MAEKKKIVLATKNRGKVREFKRILPQYDIVTMSDMGIDVEIEEDGTTFEENAMKKAETVYVLCGEITIADDSGLAVDALGGEPGIYSARYSGEGATDEANRKKLLAEMQGVPDSERTAKFVCAIAIIEKGGQKHIVRGECTGTIARSEAGDNGFGYDSLFYVEEYGKTFAEAEDFEKNKISHRGKALRKAAEILG